jgi:polyhydroxyalkanoate synthesis regulator phasin
MENRSEGIGQLVGALAKAQGSYEPIRKNRTVKVAMKAGGAYDFRYATLDSVLDATRTALAVNGLAITATVTDKLTVLLMHESGEWLSSVAPMPAIGGNWQAYGSALTYARRYLISTMLGVASESDDDGAAASGHKIESMETDIDPWAKLWDDLADKGISTVDDARKWVERCLQRSVPSQKNLTDADLPVLRDYLEGKPLPPARTMATADELKALNQAIDALVPWGTTDKVGEELAALKKTAKKAWINKMLDPQPAKPIEASAELTQGQALALTKRALAGEV